MAATAPLKRGDTFSYGCAVTLPAGTWAAACDLRDSRGVLVEHLTVTLTPPVGPATDHQLLLFAAPTATVAWPLALLHGDVRFTDAGSPAVVLHTGTFSIDVRERLTQ